MSKTIKIGVIGCGVIGKTHVAAGVKCPHGELVAVADLVPAKLEEAKKMAPGVRTYASGAELLEDRDVEAVVLAMPTYQRSPLALQAFAKGKHVLIEKPVAMNVKDLEGIIAAQKGRVGRVAACCSSRFRFLPSNAAIGQFLAAKQLGNLRIIRARGIVGAGARPTWALPDWRLKRAQNGGGYLVNWGCYDLDFVLGVTGWSLVPQSVYAQTWGLAPHLSTRATPGSEAETHFIALIRCAGGVTISFERGEFTSSAPEHVHQFIGEVGTIRTVMVGGRKTVYHDHTDGEYGVMTRAFWDGEDPNEPTSSGPLHDFVSAIAQGHAPKTSLEQAMVIQKITDAIYASAATGKSVEMG